MRITFREHHGVEFSGGDELRIVTGKTESGSGADLVVKHLRCINCLNASATYCANF